VTTQPETRQRSGGSAFAGKTAIVTGGASGIGRALAAALVAQGGRVTLADIDGDAAQRTASELAAAVTGSGSVDACRLDTRDEDGFRSLVATTIERDGRLDFLFNNAGISLGGPTHELTRAHWDRIIDVNIRGVVNGVLAAYPHMIDQGHGHIVNTASGAGLAPPPFVTAYAMTKHAVVGLSTGLRPEAALHGVRVSVLCPGSIETPILDRAPDADLPAMTSAPVTARQYLATVKQKPIPADKFASRALRHVARNQSVIVVPAAAKSLWYLQRCSPRLMEYVSAMIARKVQRDLVKPRA
jgi:NAD(P)-dependent dehydrogenase (short-subunit alcohol dehydrogenase family)